MQKKVLTFSIPRQSVQKSVAYWGARESARLELQEMFDADPFNCDKIIFQVREFVTSAVNDWRLTINSSTKRFLSELVCNAYDSFNKLNLSQEIPLILKVVIKEKSGDLWIKVMDNGAGFQNKDKSQYFSRKDFIPEDKEPSKNIGSSKIGLKYLETSVMEMRGNLFFKNRKAQGASVYLQLPTPGLFESCCIIC